MSDKKLASLLQRLGQRLSAARLARNWTQAHLAAESGISLATLGRLEAGRSVQLENWLRVLAVLGLLEALDELLPDPGADPRLELRRKLRAGRLRKRASSRPAKDRRPATGWTWDEDR
ncbi:MAG: helix-turn-helix transcriptional regulator [Planctomycetota bacterium]|nr:helix-turn-helix transcriptional regulator [Planctomycetota bacterium]